MLPHNKTQADAFVEVILASTAHLADESYLEVIESIANQLVNCAVNRRIAIDRYTVGMKARGSE